MNPRPFKITVNVAPFAVLDHPELAAWPGGGVVLRFDTAAELFAAYDALRLLPGMQVTRNWLSES